MVIETRLERTGMTNRSLFNAYKIAHVTKYHWEVVPG